MRASRVIIIVVASVIILSYIGIAFYYLSQSYERNSAREQQFREKFNELKAEYAQLEWLESIVKENPQRYNDPVVLKTLNIDAAEIPLLPPGQSSHRNSNPEYVDASVAKPGTFINTTADSLYVHIGEKSTDLPHSPAKVDVNRLTHPCVLVVGGTDGSGTRRVVQLLTSLGVLIVSEDPETYDIHADLFGGWPQVVTPVLDAAGSITYDTKQLPTPLQKSVDHNLRRLLKQAQEDSQKPQSFKLAKGGALPIPSNTHAHNVKFGFKAPVAMTLLPWWKEVCPHLMFLHVTRDGRDIAFSANQGPVVKFYNSMYRKTKYISEAIQPVKSIRLWSDWNNGIRKWAEQRAAAEKSDESSFHYFSIHTEDLVSGDLTRSFLAIQRVAAFVGSDLSDESLCCLAVEGSTFMGSHDRQGTVGKGGDEAVKKRYGKWKLRLQNDHDLEMKLMEAGGEGLKDLGYLDDTASASDSSRDGSQYECSLTRPQCAARNEGDVNWRAAITMPQKELRSEKCHIRSGVDYAGGDLRAMPSKDYDGCCNLCIAEPNCRFFTLDTGSGMCYMKARKMKVVEGSENLISGDTFTP